MLDLPRVVDDIQRHRELIQAFQTQTIPPNGLSMRSRPGNGRYFAGLGTARQLGCYQSTEPTGSDDDYFFHTRLPFMAKPWNR